MSTTAPVTTPETATPENRMGWAGLALTLVILVAGLFWAKWLPYDLKAHKLAETGAWDGKAIFGAAGVTPSWQGAFDFTVVYL